MIENEWVNVQDILSHYYGEWTEPDFLGGTSVRIPNTALLGNGDVGVSSDGSREEKIFNISKSDFWEYEGAPLKLASITIGTPSVNTDGNLAPLYSRVTASTIDTIYGPEEAIDGKWRAGHGYEGWSSEIGNPQWMMLEYDTPITFDRWIVRNDAAARPNNTQYNTSDCELQISDDGKQWQTIDTVKDNTENVIDRMLSRPYTTRFIRLFVTKGTQETDDDSTRYPRARIGAFELYDTSSVQVVNETEMVGTVKFNEREYIADATTVTKQMLCGVPVQIDSWVSATDNLFVMKIESLSESADAEMVVTLEVPVNSGRPAKSMIINDGIAVTRSSLPGSAKDSYISSAAAAARVIGAHGKYETDGDSKALLKFTLPKAGTVYVVTAICGGGKTCDRSGKLVSGRTEPVKEANDLLNKYNYFGDLEHLRNTHCDWWRDYWLKSYINLDTSDEELDLIQKYYYAALYELGIGVREGKLAPGLYGIWHTTDDSPWRSDYHLNYNFVSAFYGLATSNRTSMLLPAADAIWDYVPSGIERAKNIGKITNPNDARMSEFAKELIKKGQIDGETGIPDAVLYPVCILPYGMDAEDVYWSELLDAPFSAYPLIAYYNYTLDKDFLRERLYPYITYVLNFMEKWIVEEDGQYIWYSAYNEGSWAKNASLELGAYKMCLTSGINAAKELGDNDKAAEWQKLFDRLPKQSVIENYKGSGKTVLGLADLYQSSAGAKWTKLTDLALSNGNALPLEAVIPFGVFGYYSTEEELEILQNTVDVYGKSFNSWEQMNSFPKIFAAAVNSRYDCKTIVKKFAKAIKNQMKQNMIIDDGVHGIEKAGATEAVNNMLLLSDKGVVKLFGNWLTDKDASFVRLRAPGAFLFSASYDGKTEAIKEGATMYSEVGGKVTVASLWAEGMRVVDTNGAEVELTAGTAPGHTEELTFTFDTQAGMTYRFYRP